MATMTGAISAAEAIKERIAPVLDGLEKNMREARRVVLHGRDVGEDFVAETALKARRHPLRAVALAAGAGVLAGGLCGFVLGRQERRGEKSDSLKIC